MTVTPARPSVAFIVRPCLAAIALFLGGFTVMAGFWRFGQHDPALPGLWDYRSATVGDAILLPFLAAMLVALGDRRPPAPGERTAIAIGGIAGGISGACVVLAWLLDPTPQLNWTIPHPHMVSMPGLYHALFLVVVTTAFGALAARVLWRIRRARLASPGASSPVRASPWLAAMVGATVGFAGLVTLDNLLIAGKPATRSPSTLSTVGIISLAVIVVALVTVWATGRVALRAWLSTVVWGLVLATSVMLIELQPLSWPPTLGWSEAFWALGSMLVIALQLAYRRTALPLWWVQAMAICLVIAGGMKNLLLPLEPTQSASFWIWLIWTVASLFLLLSTCRMGTADARKEREEVALVAATIFLPALLVAAATWFQMGGFADVRGDVLSGLLAFVFPIFVLVVPAHYALNWLDEQAISPGPKLDVAICLLMVKSVVLVVATLAGASLVAEVTETRLGITARGVGATPYATVLVAALLASGALFLAANWVIHTPRPGEQLPPLPERVPIEIPRPGLLVAIAAVVVWGVTPIWLGLGKSGHPPATLRLTDLTVAQPPALVIVSLLVSAWVGYTSYESVLANMELAEFYDAGLSGKILAAACGLSAFAAVAWLFLAGMWVGGAQASMTSTLAIVMLVALGNLLTAVGCAWCLMRAAPKLPGAVWYMSLHLPVVNVAHDLLLSGYFILCVAIARFGLSWLPTSGDTFSFAQNVFPAIGLVLTLVGYTKAMRLISAEYVKSELKRDPGVLHARSPLAQEETHRLWTERARLLGQRFDRKLNWSLVASFVGIIPSGAQVAWSVYTDPTAGFTRISRLARLRPRPQPPQQDASSTPPHEQDTEPPEEDGLPTVSPSPDSTGEGARG